MEFNCQLLQVIDNKKFFATQPSENDINREALGAMPPRQLCESGCVAKNY